MSEEVKGVFVRLPLSDVEAVCSIDEDILRNIYELDEDNEDYVVDMVFRPGYGGSVDLVRQSDHLAALASLQAEVGRLREYYEANEKILNVGYLFATAEDFDRLAKSTEALKGPEA